MTVVPALRTWRLTDVAQATSLTCYSAPLLELTHTGARTALYDGIPCFGVRREAGGWCVGHVRWWHPARAGLVTRTATQLHAARAALLDDLRGAGEVLVRLDAAHLAWCSGGDRWLRWFHVRQVDAGTVRISDRMAIPDGHHRQAPTAADFSVEALERLQAGTTGPVDSRERRRESAFLGGDAAALDSPWVWLVPGRPRDTAGQPWCEGAEAIARAAAEFCSCPDDAHLEYWQEEMWQAARYRRLHAAMTTSGGRQAERARAAADGFAHIGALLFHASLRPVGDRRAASLRAAADRFVASTCELLAADALSEDPMQEVATS